MRSDGLRRDVWACLEDPGTERAMELLGTECVALRCTKSGVLIAGGFEPRRSPFDFLIGVRGKSLSLLESSSLMPTDASISSHASAAAMVACVWVGQHNNFR